MSSTRSIIAPPPFAANALTVIPPTPVAGVSYRDPTAGPASSPDGWPYAERVNSAEFNQILFQATTLVALLDKKGILGWSDLVEYTEAGIVLGSDGNLYTWIQASGPTNGGAKDPVSQPTYWSTLAKKLGAVVRVVRRVITASGSYVPSAGLLFADVENIGGAGGGGSGFGSVGNVSSGSGGSAGGYARRLYTAAEIGASAAISIGAGGLGGVAGQNTGNLGGATTFTPSGGGVTLLSPGGFGGPFGSTSTGADSNVAGIASQSALPTGGQINLPGEQGGWGLIFGSFSRGVSGRGGSSPYGKGGQESQPGAPGNHGTGIGSGGAGAGATTVSQPGGNGTSGGVVIIEYCSQ